MAKFPNSILDLAIPEKLLQLARNGYGVEGIFEKVVPPNLRMREPPRGRCHILDENGEVFASCSVETAAARYANQPGVTIKYFKPHPYHVGLWRWNEARRAEITGMLLGWAEENLIDYRDTADLYGLNKALAEAMGATRWRRIGRDDVLPYAKGFGGRGEEYLTPAGRVYLDIGVESGCIYLPQIAIEKTGTGLGTTIMEAIRAHATEKRLDVCVYKVCNKPFFARFDWLSPKERGGTFKAGWRDLVAHAEHAAGDPDDVNGRRWTVHAAQDGQVIATLYGRTRTHGEIWRVEPGRESGDSRQHHPFCVSIADAKEAAAVEFGSRNAPMTLTIVDGPDHPDLPRRETLPANELAVSGDLIGRVQERLAARRESADSTISRPAVIS